MDLNTLDSWRTVSLKYALARWCNFMWWDILGTVNQLLPTTSVDNWRRKWQPTPVFLPGKSHGRRSLVGYSPRGRQESDTTERLHFHFSLSVDNTVSPHLSLHHSVSLLSHCLRDGVTHQKDIENNGANSCHLSCKSQDCIQLYHRWVFGKDVMTHAKLPLTLPLKIKWGFSRWKRTDDWLNDSLWEWISIFLSLSPRGWIFSIASQ